MIALWLPHGCLTGKSEFLGIFPKLSKVMEELASRIDPDLYSELFIFKFFFYFFSYVAFSNIVYTFFTHHYIVMSAHVLMKLLNELGKRDKMRGLLSILSIFRNKSNNSIIQEHEC